MKPLKYWTLGEVQEHCRSKISCDNCKLWRNPADPAHHFCEHTFMYPADWDLTPAPPTHTVGEIVWHPYPLEIPPKEGKYLVTTSTNFISTAKWITNPNYTFVIPVEVIAWAEHPKPYKEKEG